MPDHVSDLEARISEFLESLLEWNTHINLVAKQDAAVILRRHIADSLQLLPLIPANSDPIADLGSGAGFPGLILAFAITRPFHLIESDRRKAAFLNHVAGRLNLKHVHVHAARIEAVALPPLAAVTARALAPLADLLPHAARLLSPTGIAIFPKGRNADAELADVEQSWRFRLQRFQSQTEPEATILHFSDLSRVGRNA